MAQVVVEIPLVGFVSALGRLGQEDAIFSAIQNPQDILSFYAQDTIMSDDPVIPLIAAQAVCTTNDLIGWFGGHED